MRYNISGALTGAQSVLVNGSYYDVTFADGKFSNNVSTVFTTDVQAIAASDALSDQVFNTAALDSLTTKTNGCTASNLCVIYTIYSYGYDNDGYSAYLYGYFNNSNGTSDRIGYADTSDFNTSSSNNATIATWTLSANQPSVSAVPVPAAAWLFATGLPVVGAFARRRKQQA